MTSQASAEFLKRFAERAAGAAALRFDAFVDLALYDPVAGYYRQARQRVGYGAGTDFFTASTSGVVFGQLVAAASTKLLGRERSARCTFIEIGAEAEGGILAGVEHPFAAVRTIRLGHMLELQGECIVFSNELFDAQPFRRIRYTAGRWRELGVRCEKDRLVETVLPTDIDFQDAPLPPNPAEGYTIDLPQAAAKMTHIISRQPWSGLFLAFDYGKTWDELTTACPAGTARAYYRHTQSNDLLAAPGEQDLTCHICWDWLTAALTHSAFTSVQLATQEAFFIRNADEYLSAAIAADAAKFTARKQSLMQLLHGAHLGQKFQVLSALRDRNSAREEGVGNRDATA